MSINIDPNYRDPRSNKVLAGSILLVVGVIILVHQFNFYFFPFWLFRWPMWLIVFGIYSGVKHNFRNSTWLVLLFLGVFFLMDDIFPHIHVWGNFWPIILIAIGVKMISSRNQPWSTKGRWESGRWEKRWRVGIHTNAPNQGAPGVDYTQPTTEPTATDDAESKKRMGDDYLDAVSIFGGVKKMILSKDFKGGEIINIFGGADIDFTQADIKGQVVIDITQVFGGVKLIVPPHWHVTSDIAAIFAGFDDKRMQKSDYGTDKILILKGTSIFAGVDIRSY